MVNQAKPSRRGFVLGAAAAGAAAAAVVALPNAQTQSSLDQPEPAKPERGGGYRLSEHVKQYYKSART